MSDSDKKVVYDDKDWRPFLRQLLICTGVWVSYFVNGLMTGAPTVFIPQIRAENNSTEIIDSDMASWLSSVVSFSGFPCVFILSILSTYIGRKVIFWLACVDTLIAFFVFYFSTTVFQLIIYEIIQGFFSAAQMVVSVVILAEYSSPKYRGMFLTIKTATQYWGIWAANALGTFCHWKTIGLAGILCASYVVLTVLVWPESPYWLASKERYKECAASHRWLKGCDDKSERELETLINKEKEYLKSSRKPNQTTRETITDFIHMLTAKEFYKPTLISIMTGLLSIFSGKLVCVVYAIDIIKKITGSESTAYTGMLILDGITVISMYLGCVLSRYLKRRVLLLGASSVGVFFLLALSLYLYLISLSVIVENRYVSLGLLISYSMAVGCGPLTMSVAVYGELIPIRSRNLAICVIALTGKLFIGLSMKLAPQLFNALDMHGTFLFFGISASVIIIILYVYLPETKDKTLQEIADSIAGITPHRNKNLEETATLVVVGKTELTQR